MSEESITELRDFARVLAEGACVCAEIDEADRPCLTCVAQAFLGEGDFSGETEELS